MPHVLADITDTTNPTRQHRTCPRAVKRGYHNNYRIKKPDQTATRHTGPATINLRPLAAPAA